jgi:hypothetical protein
MWSPEQDAGQGFAWGSQPEMTIETARPLIKRRGRGFRWHQSEWWIITASSPSLVSAWYDLQPPQSLSLFHPSEGLQQKYLQDVHKVPQLGTVTFLIIDLNYVHQSLVEQAGAICYMPYFRGIWFESRSSYRQSYLRFLCWVSLVVLQNQFRAVHKNKSQSRPWRDGEENHVRTCWKFNLRLPAQNQALKKIFL